MHISFAEYFVDPYSKEHLLLEIFEKKGDQIKEGILKNKDSVYPIKGGIPRFVQKSSNYANSFGFQWKKWSRIQFESDNIGKPMEGHTRKMFDTITANSIEHIKKDDVILDIGCGSGRFIDVIRMRCDNPIIGIDYSNSVEIAYTNFLTDKKICIVQADALNLPFRSGTFQGSFSIGVLHHTPDPEKGVKEAFRVINKGGWFGLSVYQKNSYYDKPVLKFYRKIFSYLKPLFSFIPAILYSYVAVNVIQPIARRLVFIKSLTSKCFPFVDLPDKNWSILDTFDSVTPTYASTHDRSEVFDWLSAAGFQDIKPTNWGATSFLAKKP